MTFEELYEEEYKICQFKLEEFKEHKDFISNIFDLKWWLENANRNGERLADYCITLDENNNATLDENKVRARVTQKMEELGAK